MKNFATEYDIPAIETDFPDTSPETETPPEHSRSDFPIACLPQPLRSMVEHAARATSAPASLCAVAGLGAVAASIGSGLMVQSAPACLTRANLFFLSLAASGTGKGRAFDAMHAGYNKESARRAEEWKRDIRPSLLADLEAAKSDLDRGKRNRRNAKDATAQASAIEAIRAATRDIEEAGQALAREPISNIGNATAEGIVEALAHAPGEAGAILSSEARDIVDNLLGRYSRDGKGSDEAIFLQAYSGDPVTVKRKDKALLALASPCLTLCIAVQPDKWQRLARDGRMMDSGFLARALVFDTHAPPARPSSHTIPADVAALWDGVLLALLTLRDAGKPMIVVPDLEARAVIDALAHEAADARERGGKWEEVTSFAARLAENTWRLALCFHAIIHGADASAHPLAADTAHDAASVTRWFFEETLALLSPIRADARAERVRKLETVMAGKQVRELSLRILEDRHGFPPEEVRALAAEFPARLRITTRLPGPQGGRPSESVCLPPFPAE